jgi:hypothetical protein
MSVKRNTRTGEALRVQSTRKKQINIDDVQFIQKPTSKITTIKEYVYFTNKSQHNEGSNIYRFNLPAEIMTSNDPVKFGVRSMKLIKTCVSVFFTLTATWSITSKTVNFCFTFKEDTTLDDFLVYLNSPAQQIDNCFWQMLMFSDGIEILLANYGSSHPTFTITNQFFPIGNIYVNDSTVKIKKIWNRCNLHVKSSLASETDGNHLGYTSSLSSNQIFYPPKIYKIQNQQSFTIELFDTNDYPVELQTTSIGMTDRVIIECFIDKS